MPVHGVGDRVHNSFDQESLSQGQHQFKAADKNWPVHTNNAWVGNQTSNGLSLLSNLKNYSTQQSDIGSGHGITTFQGMQGLNPTQQNLRSEFAGNQFQNQQISLNGYLQGSHVSRQHEANFLGIGQETNHQASSNGYLQGSHISKGSSMLERGNGSEFQKNSMRFQNGQPPISFNSFGGPEQVESQHPGLLQSLQRQQSGISDMQLLQQQMMLKQFQDNQRQQLLGQGSWQQNSPVNMFSSMANQAADNHSTTLLNGIPVHDSSNKSWQELMAGNLNRQQLGAPTNVQGSSSGLNLPPEQSQARRSVGLVPQQVDQSLYGVPVSGSRGNPDPALRVQNENPARQHMSSYGNSFMGGHYAAQSGQETILDGSAQRQVGASAGHSSSGGFDLNDLREVVSPQRNMPVQELHGRQDLASLLDMSQQKPSPAVVQSQKVATLDPAEEKILFGSDDNLWDAFGGETSTVGLGMSDGAGLSGGFSSMQSGKWSALMQSALAETSSGETGQQEELCGPNYRTSEPQVRSQQPSMLVDNEKQKSTWSESARGSQLGGLNSHERTENLQVDPSNRHQNFSEEKRWLDPTLVQKPLAVGERKQHMSGSWINQQSMSSQGISDKLNDSTNGWSTAENLLQSSQSSSFPRLAVGLDHSKPIESQRAGRLDSSFPNSTGMPNSSSSKAAAESTQQFQNNQSSVFWRQVGSSATPSGTEVWRRNHLSRDKDSQGLDSSENNEMHEKDNFDKKESSTGSFHSISRHGQSGASRENVLSDDNHSRNLLGSNQNQSDRAVQKPVVGRKFQYHPMGDVNADVESSYGVKSLTSSQAATQHVSNKFTSTDRSTGGMPSNRSAQSSQNMLELLNKLDQGKERESASHFSSSDRNDTNEAETSEGSVGHFQRNQSPRSQGIGLQLAPPSQRLQNLDTAVHSQSSSQISRSPQISSDRGESGHPSVFPTSVNRSSPSWKETYEGENRNYGSGAAGHISDKSPSNFPGNSPMPPFSGFPFARNSLLNQRDVVAGGRAAVGQSVNASLNRTSSHSMKVEASPDGSSPSQSAAATTPDVLHGASKDKRDSTMQTYPGNLFQQSFVSEIMQGSRTSPSPGISQPSASQRMSPNLWRAGTDQQGFFRPPHVQSSNTDPTFTRMRKLDESDQQKGENGPSEGNASLAMSQGVGEEQRARVGFWQQESSNADTGQSASSLWKNSVNHVSVPTSMSHLNYSLLNQMQAIRRIEVDPHEVTGKRFESSDSGLDSQQVAPEGSHVSSGLPTTTGDWRNVSSAPSIGDPKMLDFPVKPGDNREMSAASPDMDALQRNSSHNSISSNDPISMRTENSQISTQMGPSWFDQQGTLRNGQIMQSFDGREMAAQAPPPQKPADSPQIHDEVGQIPAASDVGTLSDALPAEVNQKKRKISVAEVQPWNKEVMKSARLNTASVTEIEWARAANRLVQKVPEETETSEHLHPRFRTKRRLILTTQLMQQLLRPPPAPFLSGEAELHYDNVVYCVGKLALGDACSAVHHISGERLVPDNNGEKILSEKPKLPEQSNHEDFVRAMEEFTRRTKKLESELLSLEQRPSMADVKVECQDLDRFCIINRFAKFHGRAQVDGTGGGVPPSSSDPNAQKPFPQRYVLALPLPRHLPERVQCLSL